MSWARGAAAASSLLAAGLLTGSCRTGGVVPPPAAQTLWAESRPEAYARLATELDSLYVSGAVKTSEGLLLPENIAIEIKSEICVESRAPGSRFWSLDYDTCFTFASADTVDEQGNYNVAVPCLDAAQTYESKHSFGELRLVQRGPVSFLADSDAGWRHQETFSSSRSQRRDLILTLEPEVFYVVRSEAVLRERPMAESPVIRQYDLGAGVNVIRFHNGWAQCQAERRIGWMEMRFLGSGEENEGESSGDTGS